MPSRKILQTVLLFGTALTLVVVATFWIASVSPVGTFNPTVRTESKAQGLKIVELKQDANPTQLSVRVNEWG